MSRYGFGLTVLVLGVFAVTSAGCQRAEFTFHPVEGTVTKGGRPLSGIEIVFLSDAEAGTAGPRATGRTDEAGHYHLRTDRGDDGAVAGKHLVLVLDPETREGRMGRTSLGPLSKKATQLSPQNAPRVQDHRKTAADAPRVPPSYSRFHETPLRVEVRPGTQVIDLEVR